ncbi:MAG TPA: DinB family protein [Thermoanaerobaculia bacterium]|nr:DinB family protein [Thermoanaerobaculia bacterium]
MNRRKLETLLLTLESTPALLARAAREFSARETKERPAGGGFSLVENVWHLADLEREAYGVRIGRLLTEENPILSNFDGDAIARARDYQRRNLAEGLGAFSLARRENIEWLRAVPAAAWKRAGLQESVGRITLADVPRMMAEHDRSHTEDIRELLRHLRSTATPARPRPTSAVA